MQNHDLVDQVLKQDARNLGMHYATETRSGFGMQSASIVASTNRDVTQFTLER